MWLLFLLLSFRCLWGSAAYLWTQILTVHLLWLQYFLWHHLPSPLIMDTKSNPTISSSASQHLLQLQMMQVNETWCYESASHFLMYFLHTEVDLSTLMDSSIHIYPIEEPMHKRRRLRGSVPFSDENLSPAEPMLLVGELVIYDRSGRCLLFPGDYELVLSSILHASTTKGSPKKQRIWGTIDNTEVRGKLLSLGLGDRNHPKYQAKKDWTIEWK